MVILGSGCSGKIALTVRFVAGQFAQKYDPMIEDFYHKEIDIDSSPKVIEILDMAGTQQFASIRDLYIKNMQGYVLGRSLMYVQPLKTTF